MSVISKIRKGDLSAANAEALKLILDEFVLEKLAFNPANKSEFVDAMKVTDPKLEHDAALADKHYADVVAKSCILLKLKEFILRLVRTSRAIIRNKKGQILIEVAQLTKRGYKERGAVLPTETVEILETFLDAINRLPVEEFKHMLTMQKEDILAAFKELPEARFHELIRKNMITKDVKFAVDERAVSCSKLRISDAFCNLITLYLSDVFGMIIEDLPETDFQTYEEKDGDSFLVTFWKWVDEAEAAEQIPEVKAYLANN